VSAVEWLDPKQIEEKGLYQLMLRHKAVHRAFWVRANREEVRSIVLQSDLYADHVTVSFTSPSGKVGEGAPQWFCMLADDCNGGDTARVARQPVCAVGAAKNVRASQRLVEVDIWDSHYSWLVTQLEARSKARPSSRYLASFALLRPLAHRERPIGRTVPSVSILRSFDADSFFDTTVASSGD
jgi:hypothetical protein